MWHILLCIRISWSQTDWGWRFLICLVWLTYTPTFSEAILRRHSLPYVSMYGHLLSRSMGSSLRAYLSSAAGISLSSPDRRRLSNQSSNKTNIKEYLQFLSMNKIIKFKIYIFTKNKLLVTKRMFMIIVPYWCLLWGMFVSSVPPVFLLLLYHVLPVK